MTRFLERHSYRGRQPAAVLADRLRLNNMAASTEPPQRSDTSLAQVEQLGLLNRQLTELDKALAVVMRRHPDREPFLSFPGIGDVIEATHIAEDR